MKLGELTNVFFSSVLLTTVFFNVPVDAIARDVGDRGAERAQDRVDSRGDRVDGDRIDGEVRDAVKDAGEKVGDEVRDELEDEADEVRDELEDEADDARADLEEEIDEACKELKAETDKECD
ncbi:hypothetical protein [Ruegeria profundi]|uniref:hypothetical protein n=1 Tax=Ruegeria profundi TaxID=1685378 RepID=UPI003C7CCE8A